MESKKINQLATAVSPSTSDLAIIGDPVTGVSKKITWLQVSTLIGTAANLQQVTDNGATTTNAINIGGLTITGLSTGVLKSDSGVISSVPFGAANGVATLAGDGKIPSSQLPSYVDDVVEVANYAALPVTGETGKLYITLDNNKVYRWGGSVYVEVAANNGVWGSITGTLSNQTDLQNVLDLKATDSLVVHLAGTETITGTKTFSNPSKNDGGILLKNGASYSLSGYMNLGGMTDGLRFTSGGGISNYFTLPSSVGYTYTFPEISGTIVAISGGNSTQYIDGTGALQTFPTLISSDKLVKLVRNQSGATMTAGTIVYISGATGNKPLITKALATGDSTSAQTYGLVQADIANNADGYVVVIGNITDIDTSALTEGQQLYLSGTTAGAYTTTKPYAPIHLVYIGIVLRSHPTQGIIGVKIQNGYEMDELHNVDAQSPSNNDILSYNTSTSLWEHKQIATTLGFTPISLASLSATSPLSYNNTTGAFSIQVATASQNGYLSSTDWSTFNNKQAALGGTGFVKISGSTISYDNSTYYLASNPSGYITLASLSAGAGISYSNITGVISSTITQYTDALARAAFSESVVGLDYSSSTGVLSTTTGYAIPTTAKQTEWDTAYTNRITSLTTTGSSGAATLVANTLNVPTYTLAGLGGQPLDADLTAIAALAGTSGFLKKTAADTWTLDTNTYLTGNQTITLSGDVSGSGATAITTTIGALKVTNAMLAGSIDLTTKVTGLLPDANIASAATWNAKQAALNGTGFVKATGTTISYDNSTYALDSAVVHLSGAETITGFKIFSGTTGTGTGDYTNISSSPLKISTASNIWRIPHISTSATQSGVYNYETGKHVYWGEPTDTGDYYFRGRTLKVDLSNSVYLVIHTGNLSSITTTGTITSGTWQGTAIADSYIASAATWNAKQNALTNPVTGTGTNNYIPKFTSTSSTIGDSRIFENTTGLGLGTASPYGSSVTIQYAEGARNRNATSSRYRSDWVVGSTGTTLLNSYDDTGAAYKAMEINSSFLYLNSIAGSGNVAIGTTADNGFKLDVNGTGRFSGVLRVDGNTDPNSGAAAFFWNQAFLGPTISGYNFEVRTGNTGSQARRLFIDESGTALFTNTIQATRFAIGGTPYINVGFTFKGTLNGNTDTWGTYQGALIHSPSDNNALAVGYHAGGGVNKGTYTGLSYRGFYQQSITTSGTGTLATAYGVYIDTLSGATASYSAYFSQTTLIGTLTPLSGGGLLQVNGNVNINGLFQINGVTIGGGGGSGVTGSGTANYLTKWTGSSTLSNSAIYESGSNIAIGSTTMIAKFNVYGAGGGSGSNNGMMLTTGNNSDYFGHNQLILAYNASEGLYAHAIKTRHNSASYAGNAIDFYTWNYGDASSAIAGKYVMTILGNGAVGIGETNPALSVGGTYGGLVVKNNKYLQLKLASSATGESAGMEFIPYTGSAYEIQANSNSQWFVYDRTNSQYRLNIFSNGNVVIGGNTDGGYKLYVTGTIYATGDVVAYSDIRVKTNIRPIENSLERITNSRGVMYDRTDNDDKDNIGFIAQELEKQFPELVSTDNQGKKGVKYQNAVAILFEAIKEQQKQIDGLKKQIA